MHLSLSGKRMGSSPSGDVKLKAARTWETKWGPHYL
jgi:hypothetical protein